MDVFSFNDQFNPKVAHQAEVPLGVKNKAALLETLSSALRFPDYFGGNWDAFDECISDLSWLPPGDVILIHRDLPMSGDTKALSTYLLILKDAVEQWREIGSNLIFVAPQHPKPSEAYPLLARRELFVVFPSDSREVVKSLMTQ